MENQENKQEEGQGTQQTPEGGEEQNKTSQADIFGDEQQDTEEQGEQEKGEGEGDENKTLEQKLEEEREARVRLEEKNTSKDENIKEMRKKLKDFENRFGGQQNQNQEGKGGEGAEGEGGEGGQGQGEGIQSGKVFDKIKTSSDLSQEEKDEMTDTEIKQYDEIASLKQGMNQLAGFLSQNQGQQNQKQGNEEGAGEGGEPKEAVKTKAQELAGGDTEQANKIIDVFNNMKFDLSNMTEEEIKERVEIAAKNVGGSKRPKEQSNPKGGAVKKGSKEDPHGVDKIVEEATSGEEGTFSL